ncbi:MAG: hypothetical protein L7F78_27280, partial [Syntrophales bacterium LBB04]|nr:hypothetical protein [Syntrophales bacterium LBB04]
SGPAPIVQKSVVLPKVFALLLEIAVQPQGLDPDKVIQIPAEKTFQRIFVPTGIILGVLIELWFLNHYSYGLLEFLTACI